MESQPQNPEFRNNPENFHQWVLIHMPLTSACSYLVALSLILTAALIYITALCVLWPDCVHWQARLSLS